MSYKMPVLGAQEEKEEDQIAAEINDINESLKTTEIGGIDDILGKYLDFENNFSNYQNRLREVYGSPRGPNFYDLASTVGAAMLSADPATGAFKSMGMGFGKFAQEEKARREARFKEDRAIGIKAFELAKSDEDSANKIITDYLMAVAKKDPSLAVKAYQVHSEGPIEVNGQIFDSNEIVYLTESEAFANRSKLRPAANPSSGSKFPSGGALAVYQTKEDAKKTIRSLGLDVVAHPEAFAQAVATITAPTEADIGRNIIQMGQATRLRPFEVDGEIVSVQLDIETGTPSLFRISAESRLKLLAKAKDVANNNAVAILPSVDNALTLLREGTETGPITQVSLGLRAAINQAFSLNDPQIVNQESLQSASNYLGPKMRPVGSGSTSDMEFKAYLRAILELGRTPKANYLSLYVFRQMTQKSIELNQLEEELLTSEQYSSLKAINEKLREYDTGIFEKYTGNVNNKEEMQQWFDRLPDGAVILNRDDKGAPLYDTDDVYLIKGWKEKEGDNWKNLILGADTE
tara:strand:+ start:29796 stop:31352 length:1557 start_codon:yes stop_codon:yes gene_type:complete